MELNNSSAHGPQSDEVDRLSTLPDDVLLFILVRVEDLCTVVRTSALSTRWRRLPWLLPELSIHADDFIPDQLWETIDANVIHDAVLTLTAATKSLLAKHLIDAFSSDGLLVRDAVECGLLKDLNLVILDDAYPPNYSTSYAGRRAKDMEGIFSAYPSVLHCITTLYLDNMRFVQSELHHILFDCCKQLKHLTLWGCDVGHRSVWKIDAPNSKLRVLDLSYSWFERVELISLPKLEKLVWCVWASSYAPLYFGFVPSLEELHLANPFNLNQNILKLSELLHGTAGIQNLALGFRGENIWVQPEIKQLASTFSKLRKLSVTGIFVEFDLLWTIVFLEAAPCLQILHITVEEHTCVVDVQPNSCHEKSSPQWELDSRGSKNLLLKELQIVGFRPLEQQLTFIRAMLERAPNLRAVVLKEYEECKKKKCVSIRLGNPQCASTRPAFPKNRDEQDTVVKQVTDGTLFSCRIIFCD